MKYLVTGGAGFIGSHVVERIVSEGNNVVIVDDLSMGSVDNIPNSELVTFYKESITNYEFMDELLVREKFDVIYLLAAIASVADTVERPYETHAVNQEANLFILKTVHEKKLMPKRILFASSATVYGPKEGQPKKESDPVEPLTAYAIDKYATERFVLAYANLYNIQAVAVRFFNVYGPRQNPASPYSGVLSIIVNALKHGKEFTMFGDGLQTRDFVYVKDVVAALKLVESREEAIGKVFNVATGTSRTLLTTIGDCEQAAGKKLNMTFKPARQGDIKKSAANIKKLSDIGYTPCYDFGDGIKEYWTSVI
ncbi:NAD-dependent epimerase/dehydratase family protein [Weissella cibaria]|uniref:NAD-dependent epimerase/dehydratase family protein n=1 Tax=Weissella cibaria TaxID=137591 RepID=UPI0021AF40CC|nr:NAD-dependent epimerase/dehydratase family protein [Weissella cibaria]MCT0021403.1 NAD-dependent epimerase/dehydratase family protein [Weissella cibaria]